LTRKGISVQWQTCPGSPISRHTPSFVFELLFQLVRYNTEHQQNTAEQDDQLYAL
jgi:hypothetical protein